MHPITKLVQLEALQNDTMIYAVVVAVVALLLSFIIANLIPYQGGTDRSYIKRRIFFIVIGIVGVLGFYLYNDIVVMDIIHKTALKAKFMTTNLICIGINAGVYFIAGIIIMAIFRHTKFGSILNLK